jgi:D-glycero-D-manno-heptose 1,7-bisphosphate phosphatase
VSAARAVFLDKDGTLVDNVPYNVEPARIRLAPGAVEAVQRLAARGYRIIVVSNQPGVGLGYFEAAALGAVERHLQEILPALDGFYYCPHAPGAGCECRKPACGLLTRAAQEHAVDLGGSWMVGDILDDIEAGRRAGCRTVLIDNGNETEWDLSAARRPHRRAQGLAQAASLICGAT